MFVRNSTVGKTYIPEEFTEKYTALLGTDAAEFLRFCTIKQPKSIWVNSLKVKPQVLFDELSKKGWKLKQLFHPNAFALEGVERPGQSEEFKRGLFNVQERSSMIPAIVLGPKPGETVLDAAAAPGNKTLQLACMMQSRGKLVAVDKNVERYKSLVFNITKFGLKNVIPKRMDLLSSKKKEIADKVLLDAPCSSEGVVRKDFDALRNWNQALVGRKSELQKKMVLRAFELLKKGGTLVYSTCSLSPEEDEEVVDFLLKKRKAEVEKINVKDFKLRPGILEYKGKDFDSNVQNCARVYPQDNDSQAFFVAKIRKL